MHLFYIVLIFFYLTSHSQCKVRDLIVLTDMQPDDRIALSIIGGNQELSDRLLFVGTTLLNTGLKKVLAERQLKQMRLKNVNVYAGTGGHPSDYPLHVESAKAAFEYMYEEGQGILPKEQLERYRMKEKHLSQITDDAEFYRQIHMESMADPEDLARSFMITRLRESTMPTVQERYKDDYETVVKILNRIDIGFAPKYVYRLPKLPDASKESARALKVVFPIHKAIGILFTEWMRDLNFIEKIRKTGYPNISFLFPVLPEKFELIKNRVINEIEEETKNKTNEEKEGKENSDKEKEEIEEGTASKTNDEMMEEMSKHEKDDQQDDEEEQYFDPSDHLSPYASDSDGNDDDESHLFHDPTDNLKDLVDSAEVKIIKNQEDLAEVKRIKNQMKRQKKKKKKKMEKLKAEQEAGGSKEAKNEPESDEDHDGDGPWIEVKNKNRRKTDHEMAKELTKSQLDKYFNYGEEKNSVIIKGLPYANLPFNTKGAHYKHDFEAARELLYAIGIELPPLAVLRRGKFIKGEDEKGHPLQVFLRNKLLTEMAVIQWERYWFTITANGAKQDFNNVCIVQNEREVEKPTIGPNIVTKYLTAINEADEYAVHIPSKTNVKHKQRGIEYAEKHFTHQNPLQRELEKALLRATKENPLEILLMTAATDLVQVLNKNPEFCERIRVHLMGGWAELKPYLEGQRQVIKEGIPTIWANYNLSMAPESTRRLFELNVPMRLYTYRSVRELFKSSVNAQEFGDVIKMIERSDSPVFKDFLTAARSWDKHVLKTMPYLYGAIGEHAGKQFSPSDPILVLGLLYPEFLINPKFRKPISRKVKVKIAPEELSMGDVLQVQIEYDAKDSEIELVTSLNTVEFREKLKKTIYNIGLKEIQCGRCKEYGHLMKNCPAVGKRFCYNCGKPGHIASNCPRS